MNRTTFSIHFANSIQKEDGFYKHLQPKNGSLEDCPRLRGEEGQTFLASKITESTLEVSVVIDDTTRSPSQPRTSIISDETNHGCEPEQEGLHIVPKCHQSTL